MILERGALLNGRYRIVEILGQGGMGSVYRAVDENLGMEVAVKDNLFTTDEYARQFRREAVILANLRHPNLPRVTDHFVIENQGQYLVMDYIEGEDLRQRMDRIGTLPDEEVVIVGAAICDALYYLGSRNPPIVHRDIKPGNVKITPQGEIFLVDFGLAKEMFGSQATTTGARAMTPGYSPPEQYGTARTDQRSDVFSLGATLYAALTGAIPEDALARAMNQVELTPVRKHNPRVSRRLAAVIEKSLSTRPEDRYQSAEEFKEALRSSMPTSRRRNGEYLIAPPPEIYDQPLPLDAAPPQSPPPQSQPERLQRVGSPSPLPMPISSNLDDPYATATPRSSGGRAGCWVVMVLALVLLVSAGLGAYAYDPDLVYQAAALVVPSVATSTPTPTAPVTSQGGSAAPTEDPLVDLVFTFTPSPTASLTPPPPTPTVTPTPGPTFTPLPTPMGGGAGSIAFAADETGSNQIYTIHVDGTNVQKLTDLQDGACQPAWSPDGFYIVFISPCPANQELYPGSAMFIMNADGSGLMPLPTVPGGDFDPAWSPDGKKIAFTSLRSNGRPQIFVITLADNSVIRLSEIYTRDSFPAWSPDGKKIAFISEQQEQKQIWVMDADGRNRERFSPVNTLIYLTPVWSPDAQQILATQLIAAGGIPRLVVAPYPAQRESENVVNQDQRPAREGRYSQDGNWIIFEGWPAGLNHNIFMIASNGAARTQITSLERSEFDASWQPVLSSTP
jgi:serine/threonine protein kinase/Tol biopolymer transport system component